MQNDNFAVTTDVGPMTLLCEIVVKENRSTVSHYLHKKKKKKMGEGPDMHWLWWERYICKC